MGQEKEKDAANAAEASSVPLPSGNRIPKPLKPKPKIVKTSLHGNLLKINKGKRNKKRKSVSVDQKESNDDGKGQEKVPIARQIKRKGVSVVKQNDKSQHSHNTKENVGELQKKQKNRKVIKKLDIVDKSGLIQMNKEKHDAVLAKSKQKEKQNDKSQHSQNTKENVGELQKKQQNQKVIKKLDILDKSGLMQMNKEKHDAVLGKRKQKEKMKEKLGGLIFMCSAKTKPDCFRYRVMGVSMNKENLVLGIKPGLKLFLYDFDLKLMYGIYRASSCGGMKLEPAAFGGAFPVQVRFSVHQDCYPLPESVFRKAIKENYNEKNKFKTELTVHQVRKLTDLFRPAELLSKARTVNPLPMVTIPDEGARESRPHPYREPFARDSRAYDEVRRSSALSHENGQHLSHRELPSLEKEDYSQDRFLTEKEYRTYGLRREISSQTAPSSYVDPASELHPRGHMTEHLLGNPYTVYRDIAPSLGESSHHEQLLLNDREQIYAVGARQGLQHPIPAVTTTVSSLDTYPMYSNYSSQYAVSSMDPYAPLSRREEVPSGSYSLSGSRGAYPTETVDLRAREAYLNETDHLGRRGLYPTETVYIGRREDDVGRLYSTHASNALTDYNWIHRHQETGAESSLATVSSRYSFGGPSLLYR